MVNGQPIKHMGSNDVSGLGLDLESVLMSFRSSWWGGVNVESGGSIISGLTSRSVHLCLTSTMLSFKVSLVKESQIACLRQCLTNFRKNEVSPKWINCHLTEMMILSIRKCAWQRWKKEIKVDNILSSPGIEPGCSAPQAEILTTVWTRPTPTLTVLIYKLDILKGWTGGAAVQNVSHHHTITKSALQDYLYS